MTDEELEQRALSVRTTTELRASWERLRAERINERRRLKIFAAVAAITLFLDIALLLRDGLLITPVLLWVGGCAGFAYYFQGARQTQRKLRSEVERALGASLGQTIRGATHSRIAKVVGAVKFAQADLIAPYTHRRCVYWETSVQLTPDSDLETDRASVEFWLDDGTDQALVRIAGARILALCDYDVEGRTERALIEGDVIAVDGYWGRAPAPLALNQAGTSLTSDDPYRETPMCFTVAAPDGGQLWISNDPAIVSAQPRGLSPSK